MAKVGVKKDWHGIGLDQSASRNVQFVRKAKPAAGTGARAWVERRLSRLAAEDNLAATHRSLWLGSRPRTGHRDFFVKKHRVLLVDDDPGVRRMIQRVLEEENYIVIPAADGREAIELAASHSLDLVLLDLNLPGQNGWNVFEQLSKEHPLLPIIIITARPNQLFPALASGVGALMEKPLDLPKLLRTMSDLLAEPVQVRLARTAGERAEFHYLPAKGREPATK